MRSKFRESRPCLHRNRHQALTASFYCVESKLKPTFVFGFAALDARTDSRIPPLARIWTQVISKGLPCRTRNLRAIKSNDLSDAFAARSAMD